MLKKLSLITILSITSLYSYNKTYKPDNVFIQKDEYSIMEKSLKNLNLSNKQKIAIRNIRLSHNKNKERFKTSNVYGYTVNADYIDTSLYIKRQKERCNAEARRKAAIMEEIFNVLNKEQKAKLSNIVQNKLKRIKRTTKRKINYY